MIIDSIKTPYLKLQRKCLFAFIYLFYFFLSAVAASLRNHCQRSVVYGRLPLQETIIILIGDCRQKAKRTNSIRRIFC